MKKCWSRVVSFVLVLVLVCPCFVAGAVNQIPTRKVVLVTDDLVIERIDGPTAIPRDVLLSLKLFTGRTIVSDIFNAVTGEGDAINFYFDNREGSTTIYPTLFVCEDIVDDPAIKVEKGTQATFVATKNGLDFNGEVGFVVLPDESGLSHYFYAAIRQYYKEG